LLAIMNGKRDPGPPLESAVREDDASPSPHAEHAATDFGQLAHDQIVAQIEGRFRGHELTRLVEAILGAEGYYTEMSPAGRDGGNGMETSSSP
jgi:restriction system protein